MIEEAVFICRICNLRFAAINASDEDNVECPRCEHPTCELESYEIEGELAGPDDC